MVKTDSFSRNNFDLLRILAASQVMVAFVSPSRLGYRIGLVPMAGSLPGVPVFFIISGFLCLRIPGAQQVASRLFHQPLPCASFRPYGVASASPYSLQNVLETWISRDGKRCPGCLDKFPLFNFSIRNFFVVWNGCPQRQPLDDHRRIAVLFAPTSALRGPVAQIENDQVLGALLVLFFLLSALLWTLDIPRQTEKWLQVTFLPTFHCSCSAFGYAGGPARIPFIERQSVDLAHRLRLVGKRTRSGCFPLALSRLVLGLLTISSAYTLARSGRQHPATAGICPMVFISTTW